MSKVKRQITGWETEFATYLSDEEPVIVQKNSYVAIIKDEQPKFSLNSKT